MARTKTKRALKIHALELAFWRIHDASRQYPEQTEAEGRLSEEDHDEISKALDNLAQTLWERVDRMKRSKPASKKTHGN